MPCRLGVEEAMRGLPDLRKGDGVWFAGEEEEEEWEDEEEEDEEGEEEGEGDENPEGWKSAIVEIEEWFVDNIYKKSKRWDGGSESESSVESRSSEDWEDEGAEWESDEDGTCSSHGTLDN